MPPFAWESEAHITGGVCGTLAAEILIEVNEAVSSNESSHGLPVPRVALIVVGRHPAAISYATSTIVSARAAGVRCQVVELDESVDEGTLAAELRVLNDDDSVHGIVLQLPLPAHLNACTKNLTACIGDMKDVDGLKEGSLQRFMTGRNGVPSLAPCIAVACEEVLRAVGALPQTHLKQTQVLMLGIPPLLAPPLEAVLLEAGCSVSHSSQSEAAACVRAQLQKADVLLTGVRRPDVVAAQWVRDGCVILDLGLSSVSAPSPPDIGSDPEQRDVLCVCCSDGLSAITAALRIRNVSNTALFQQGFLACHDLEELTAGTQGLPTYSTGLVNGAGNEVCNDECKTSAPMSRASSVDRVRAASA